MTPELGTALLVGLVVYLGFPYVLGKIRRRRNLKKLQEAVNNAPLLGVVYPVEIEKKDKN